MKSKSLIWFVAGVLLLCLCIASVSAVPPVVSSIDPSEGASTGGTPVSIYGTNFATGASFGVTIHGASATNVEWISTTEIHAKTPLYQSQGAVVVTNGNGEVSNSNVLFSYCDPSIHDWNPKSGPTTGGTSITIEGHCFSSTAKVMFGDYEWPPFDYIDWKEGYVSARIGEGVISVNSPAAIEGIPGNVGLWVCNIDENGNCDYDVQDFTYTETYYFVKKWGGVSHPNQMAVYSGNIYVADAGNNQIQWFTLNGVYQGKFGSFGSGIYNFNNPMSIAIDQTNGNIYVADQGNNRIQMFDSNWNWERNWYSGSPFSVAVGSHYGYVYVAAQSHPLGIHIYNPVTGGEMVLLGEEGGSVECTWPGPPPAGKLCGTLYGVAVDSSDNVYATDYYRVFKYDTGGFVKDWGNPGVPLQNIPPQFANGVLELPSSIALDSAGNVYVTDYYNYRVQKFTSDGAFVTNWGTNKGVADGEFTEATGIAVDTSGNVYVADQNQNRIQKFSLTAPPSAPAVLSITPTSGPSIGGTKVTITGTDLTDATAVTFGGTTGSIQTITATEITATSPDHAAGQVDVRVTTPGGTSAIVAGDKFTYLTGRPASIAYGIDKYFDGDPAKPGNEEKELQQSNVELPAGTPLKLVNGQSCPSLDHTTWVSVTDNSKNTNLGHLFTYAFYADTEPAVECISDMPPADEPADGIHMVFSHEAGNYPNPGGWTTIDVPPTPDPQCQNPVSTNNYALLISGGGTNATNYGRYYNDIKFMYKTLVNDYKYNKANIKVLMSDGLNDAADQFDSYNTDGTKHYINSEQDLDGDGTDDVNGAADRANITAKLTSWAGLSSSSTLLIFTTGHGNATTSTNGDSNANAVKLLLWQRSPYSATENITDSDFASYLPPNAKITMMMQQCYGGGFKDNVIITGKVRSLAAAAKGSQTSHSNDFSYPWISGVAWHDSAAIPIGVVADAGTMDGLIQMNEAFNYANRSDPSVGAGTETPTFSFVGTGSDILTPVTCGSPTQSIKNVSVTPTPWNATSSGTVTWNATGLSGISVKIDLMKGSGQGVPQATFPTTKLATLQTASWTIPKVLPDGGVDTDYWIKITTTNQRPEVTNKSSMFTIKNVTAASPATLTINSDANKPSLIEITDTQGLAVQPGFTTNKTFTLPAGTYYVKVSRSCTIPMTAQTITLGSGASQTKTYPLTEVSATDCANGNIVFGSIDITSTPNVGYEVYIKPAAAPASQYITKGTNTPTIENVVPGSWTVKLEPKDGYAMAELTVTVPAEGTVIADFVLLPDPGWYKFTGFDAPVDMSTPSLNVYNTANAGKNIPVKWHLSDGKGYVSSSLKFDMVIDNVPCPVKGITYDEIEVLDTTTITSGLTYQENGAWHYNWKTEKGFAKTCKNIYLKYHNGLISSVGKFQFKTG